MKSMLNEAWIIAWKDLQIEWRSKQVLPTMIAFSGLVIVIFSFAFDPTVNTVKALVPGLIWIITVFAGMLGLNRSFMSEQVNESMDGLIISPISATSIYLGKVLSNLIIMLAVQAVSIPFLFLLFDFSFSGYFGLFIAVIGIGTFGFVSIGTFLAVIAGNAGSGEMLLPLLLFPITVPIIIAVVQSTKIILIHHDKMEQTYGWLQLAAGYDIIFFGLCLILFQTVLEV